MDDESLMLQQDVGMQAFLVVMARQRRLGRSIVIATGPSEAGYKMMMKSECLKELLDVGLVLGVFLSSRLLSLSCVLQLWIL